LTGSGSGHEVRGEPTPEAVLGPLEAAALAAIRGARSSDELAAAAADALGRRSTLAEEQRRLAGRPPAARPIWGRALQEVRARLEGAVAAATALLEEAERQRRLAADRLDLTEVLPAPTAGHLHVVTQTLQVLEDVFLGMGFAIAEGPEVEDDWHNFTALNTPPGHPARDAQDSFYLDVEPAGSMLLRTQTSPVQIRLMESSPLPIYAVVPGRVYRRDTADASHLPSFHQLEGLVVDRGIGFPDLAGTIETFTTAYFGPGVRSRLRPGFFPFTEPSAEFDITCTVCGGEGCRTCRGVGWLEMGGCGLVDPAVFELVGIDPEIWSGFAFGFGLDRLAAMRWGIPDVRLLMENDVRFLAQF
jgi:phenylalanyl-tRNA synthetase alpha chain